MKSDKVKYVNVPVTELNEHDIESIQKTSNSVVVIGHAVDDDNKSDTDCSSRRKRLHKIFLKVAVVSLLLHFIFKHPCHRHHHHQHHGSHGPNHDGKLPSFVDENGNPLPPPPPFPFRFPFPPPPPTGLDGKVLPPPVDENGNPLPPPPPPNPPVHHGIMKLFHNSIVAHPEGSIRSSKMLSMKNHYHDHYSMKQLRGSSSSDSKSSRSISSSRSNSDHHHWKKWIPRHVKDMIKSSKDTVSNDSSSDDLSMKK